MNQKKFITELIARLKRAHPDAAIALHYSNPLEILVATILSAQCTDERVNLVTKDLFKKYRTVGDYARVPQEELEGDIRSTGFFRNKAKNIRGAASLLLNEFNGEVPRSMEELLRLPGVARKTANVVLGNAFGIAEGVVVDTHIFRLSHRLGLSEGKTPEKVEENLMALVPQDLWILFGHQLIFHGRRICHARKPLCSECFLSDLCPSAFKF
ncbi:MAG: endonuclease III [bacterium]